MNSITLTLILLSIAFALVGLYFDLRKVESKELVIVKNKSYSIFFKELEELSRPYKSNITVESIFFTEEDYKQKEKEFLESIELSKKYKVNYEVDKTRVYPTFELYKRYVKENRPQIKETLLLEFKEKKESIQFNINTGVKNV